MLVLVAVALPIIGSVLGLYAAAKGALRTRDALAAHNESSVLINVLAWIDSKLLRSKPMPVKAPREPAPSREGYR